MPPCRPICLICNRAGDVGTEAVQSFSECAVGFVEACDTGLGWAGCARFCQPDATFSAQCDLLAGHDTIEAYADWVRDLLQIIPNARFELKSCGFDAFRQNVTVFSIFSGTHTHDGGPVPPTGRSFEADYVYAIDFRDGRIVHLTKVWNAPWTLRELGWIEETVPA